MYESAVNLEWTTDKSLLVTTRLGVYLYKPVRTDRPLVQCQNQLRQSQLDDQVMEGHYWSLEALQECKLHIHKCTKGTYQDERGQSSCKNCERGQYEPFEGSEACKECLPGKFQYFEGRDSCDDCLPGFYSDYGSYGLGPGEHSAIELEYTCDSCPIGYFSMEKSASHYKKCKSDDFCDIESTIFPHATCTPRSDFWIDATDHLHQFCCSTSSSNGVPYEESMRLGLWRNSSKIYCVNRQKIKVLPKPDDCVDEYENLMLARNRHAADLISDQLDILLASDDMYNASLDRLFEEIDSYSSKWQNTSDQYWNTREISP